MRVRQGRSTCHAASQTRSKGALRLLRRSTCGQSLVEMALVLPMLFTLFFGIFEMGRHFYTRINVRHAVASAARFAVTGNVLPDPNGDPLTRAESVETVLRDKVSHLNVSVDSVFTIPADGGGPEEVVQVVMLYTYEFSMPTMHEFFPDMQFTARTIMRNEPYFE